MPPSLTGVEDEEEQMHNTTSEKAIMGQGGARNSSSSHSSSDDNLDEEDFELIEENTGRKIQPAKKYRRLQRRRIFEEEESTSSMSYEYDSDDEGFSNKKENELSSMFDDNATQSSQIESKLKSRNDDFYPEEEEKEEDLSDFIEEDLEEEVPLPIRTSRPSKSHLAPTSSTSSFSDIWQEMVDIFGEGFDMEVAPEYVSETKPKKVSLEEIYEPSEIAAKMCTTKDEEIKLTDIPERIQLRDGSHRAPLSDTEHRMESVFIAFKIEKMARRPTSDDFRKNFINAIATVLKFLRDEYLEIPFILNHRKEYYQEHLTPDDLWAIYDHDGYWNILQGRKTRLLAFLERHDSSLIQKPQIDEIHLVHFLHRAELDEEDVEDCFDYIAYKYGKEVMAQETEKLSSTSTGTKPPSLKRPLSTIRRSGSTDGYQEQTGSFVLPEFLEKIGLTPRQFGINLVDMMKRFEPIDAVISPESLAQGLITDRIPHQDAVLEQAINGLAKEFFMEPLVRKAFRSLIPESLISIISTTELPHEYAHLKGISQIPGSQLVSNGEFLQVIEAERRGLLQFSVEVDFPLPRLQQLESFFMSEHYGINSERWNPFRRQVLKRCWEEHIIGYLRRRHLAQLHREAQESIGRLSQHVLTEKLLFGRWSPSSSQVTSNQVPDTTTNHRLNNDSSSSSKRIIMSISWGEGPPNTLCYAAIVNEDGLLVDSLRLSLVVNRGHKLEDNSKLIEFIEKHRPHVIGIAGCRPNTKSILLPEIERIVVQELQLAIPVLIADDDTAQIFQHSRLATEEFQGQPPALPYIVSVARRLLDPLCEFSRLALTDNLITQIRFHPLQNTIDPSELRQRFLERALINITNIIGVDPNHALRSTFWSAPLAFCCGLGPRKAQALLRAISKTVPSGFLERRADLLRYTLLGKRVFFNCVSFLRIDPFYLPKRRHDFIDVLDQTRIHPENYNLARKIAADALEIEEPFENDDEENLSAHVAEVMEHPSKLADLMVEEYAKELERKSRLRKRFTLQDIIQELRNPYLDRRQFQPPSIDRVFEMISGETDATLAPGLILPFEVIKINDRSVLMKQVDGFLTGTISIRNLADHYVSRPDSVVKMNQILPCRILSINKERCALELSARPSDVNLRETSKVLEKNGRIPITPEYVPSIIGSAAYRAVMGTKPGSRTISHPLFKNLNRIKTENLLAQGQDGDIIIRPSSKGFNYVVISWRLALDVYHHIEVREEKKDTPWTLGHTLYIGELKFEDLDEIIARYVEPLIGLCREVTTHPKYLSTITGKRDVEVQLKKEKAQQPKRIIYGMSMIPEQPCSFLLSYLPFETIYHDTFLVIWSGFQFRGQSFKSIDEMLNFFKQDHMARQVHHQQKQRQ